MSKRATHISNKPKYKRGDHVFLSGESNPCVVIKRVGEADTGNWKDGVRDGVWVKDWLYEVRDAKGSKMRVWL